MDTSQIKALSVFIGKWDTRGKIFATATNAEIAIEGLDTYEWCENEFFIKHQVAVLLGNKHQSAIEFIRFDAGHKRFVSHSFDSAGEYGEYVFSLSGYKISITGKTMRFRGSFLADYQQITGIWDTYKDLKWIPSIKIILEKQK